MYQCYYTADDVHYFHRMLAPFRSLSKQIKIDFCPMPRSVRFSYQKYVSPYILVLSSHGTWRLSQSNDRINHTSNRISAPWSITIDLSNLFKMSLPFIRCALTGTRDLAGWSGGKKWFLHDKLLCWSPNSNRFQVYWEILWFFNRTSCSLLVPFELMKRTFHWEWIRTENGQLTEG